MVQGGNNFGTKFLLDCGATTIYVSRGFVKKNKLKVHVYADRTIKVMLGDNKIGESILELVMIEIRFHSVRITSVLQLSLTFLRSSTVYSGCHSL
ncbi:hypothetical protein F442_02094 [Phytophthora nicotianae P10297]|uniref:Uncharacterized protein n=1 Tax=Phytophthora nicotianae P10297 TaxID=1317064 RepID=W3A144_PHYNI|nr:hypothetical protein F442_02094 [Phytophthora nicotianae P10297]